jgi:membrane associated rhomboid family serine protease
MNFSIAPFTYNLLFLNIIISGIAFLIYPELIERWGFRPYEVKYRKQYYRYISSGFLHGSLPHLLFNMFTLYSFGPLIENILGGVNFLILYIGSELLAGALTYWKYKEDSYYNAIGASGAISGVIMSFCIFYPFEQIQFFFVPMPALLFAALYIGFSVYATRSGQGKSFGNIAHEAHLGGALGGILLTFILKPAAFPFFLSHFGF